MKPRILVCAALLGLASASAPAATRATSYSDDTDPARWYVPAATPQQKYENAMTEARNALAEALKDCRSSAERQACESAARAQFDKETAEAKGYLAPNRQIG